jgi:peroxiredoxin Q/BCP
MFSLTINTLFSQKISLAEGELAPYFELLDQDKNMISSTDFKGRRSVIYFFPYADTPGWVKEACGFRNIFEEFEKNNILVFGISYNNPSALKKFKVRYNLPFSFLSDAKKVVAKSFGADGLFTPKRMTFVIDENGKVEKIYKKVNINTHAETILKDLTS